MATKPLQVTTVAITVYYKGGVSLVLRTRWA